MAIKSLAIKYRPQTFDDVTEQGSIKTILGQQLDTGTIKNAYLFCGGAGTGKTTCARIFANEINNHQGNPIEMDAASNSGVDDVRDIIQQAKTKSLDSEYKVFIIDECHSISNTGWQAFLKLIEEPPAKSIFIFCTTDPQKIPKTILSRVQRYDFQRISHSGIVDRLKTILDFENKDIMEEYGDMDSASDIEWAREQHLPIFDYDLEAVDYIAKIADGGMRDAITLMDKCLAYSTDLTLDNVRKALGVADYDLMLDLNDAIFDKKCDQIIKIIESVHFQGLDLKQFIKSYTQFILDINKYYYLKDFKYLSIPNNLEAELKKYGDFEYNKSLQLLKTLVKLNSDIKWSTSPKPDIEAVLILEAGE